jgi:hypothetical protein
MDNSFYYMTGEKFNQLEDAISITPTTENVLFPKENLYSQDQGEVFRFNTVGTDDVVTVDLNKIINGTFETWTESDVPDDWTDESTGTGALSEETTIVNSGSSALKLVGAGASDIAICQQELQVLSGKVLTIEGAIRGDGVDSVNIQVRCLETGKYLNSSNTWQTAVTSVATRSTASYNLETSTFTMDDFSTTGRHLLTLQIQIYTEGTGYADGFALWQHWNFASIHGHNLGSMITPEIRSSTDDFSAVDVKVSSAISLQWPSFYEILGSTVTSRYARLKMVGTNHEPIEISKLVIGFINALPQSQQGPYNMNPRISNIINKSRGGHESKLALAQYDSGTLPLIWIFTEAQYITFRNEIEKRTKLGNTRALIVPDSVREEVYFGTFSSSFPTERNTAMGIFTVQAAFIEDGFVMRVT